ncbi:MAG: hypothetical protein JKY45_13060 [Emcibacter sp.]|nr:hypothetical protein [Emcibacter sp.]
MKHFVFLLVALALASIVSHATVYGNEGKNNNLPPDTKFALILIVSIFWFSLGYLTAVFAYTYLLQAP